MESTFGDQIKRVRRAHNLSQTDLAKKANISLSSLRRYEADERQPNYATITALAQAVGLPVGEFLWFGEMPKPQFAWMGELQEKLKHIGCNLGLDEEDAAIWIESLDGRLDVSSDDIEELNERTNLFVKFQIEELRKKYHLEAMKRELEYAKKHSNT